MGAGKNAVTVLLAWCKNRVVTHGAGRGIDVEIVARNS